MKTNESAESLEIKTSAFSASAKGSLVVTLIIAVIASGIPAYLIWAHTEENRLQTAKLAQDRNEQFKNIQLQQRELKGSVDSLVYVMALPPERRAEIKLGMPEALREKMLEHERGR